jgi:hypothetical protein
VGDISPSCHRQDEAQVVPIPHRSPQYFSHLQFCKRLVPKSNWIAFTQPIRL